LDGVCGDGEREAEDGPLQSGEREGEEGRGEG
jgi:hypothetical protein